MICALVCATQTSRNQYFLCIRITKLRTFWFDKQTVHGCAFVHGIKDGIDCGSSEDFSNDSEEVGMQYQSIANFCALSFFIKITSSHPNVNELL